MKKHKQTNSSQYRYAEAKKNILYVYIYNFAFDATLQIHLTQEFYSRPINTKISFMLQVTFV